ncbi:MAG: hypothetical protein Q7T49_02750 [bacterium]|nr:hypothetical protein [bacterium]
MEFHKLKELLSKVEKYPGTVSIDPGPIINEGYPSNFNLSFAWYEWTKKEGVKGSKKQYISFAGDMFYTKCQPCIRFQDWKTIVENGQNKYRYLSYFHMADVSGLMAKIDSSSRKEIGVFAIKSLLSFFESQNIDLKNIFVSYCVGGKVSKLTAGKYTFDKNIESDPFYDDWIKLGISKENMIADETRDTLLSLKNYSRPSPWGYRNEIFCKHNGKLLDIATIEHLVFEPIFDEQMDIVNITDYRHAFSISAVGVERLLMVLNNFNDIRQVDIIAPLYELIRSKIEKISEEDIDTLVQTLRPIQAILITDEGKWKNLNSRRKEIARSFYLEFADVWAKYNLKIGDSLLTDFLNLNAELLKNDKMKNRVESVKIELEERILTLAKNKHLSEEARHKLRELGGEIMNIN